MKLHSGFFGFFVTVLLAQTVVAQSLEGLGAEASAAPQQSFGLQMPTEPKPKPQEPAKVNELKTTEEVKKALQTEQEQYKKEREKFFMPGGGVEKLFLPTQDGSTRGKVAVLENDDKGQSRANSQIFLFMDNFGIDRSLGGMVTCSMRFAIISNLDSKLVALDAKLVWPKMTTTVSFANVAPNTPMAYNYTLMGEGCYSMDKMPNIVVNRCRVRGTSSAQCAEKIIWLTDKK